MFKKSRFIILVKYSSSCFHTIVVSLYPPHWKGEKTLWIYQSGFIKIFLKNVRFLPKKTLFKNILSNLQWSSEKYFKIFRSEFSWFVNTSIYPLRPYQKLFKRFLEFNLLLQDFFFAKIDYFMRSEFEQILF